MSTLEKNHSKPEILSIENPLKTLHHLADRLYARIEDETDIKKRQIIEKLLLEILKSQAHFLTGIFVGIYLQDDYKKVKIDASVSLFLKHTHISYNELIGLSETLCLFLREKGFEEKYGREFFSIPFKKIRLKIPPLSDAVGKNTPHMNINYHEHIKKTIDRLTECSRVIGDGKIEIILNARCKNDFLEFQKYAGQIVLGKKLSEIDVKNETIYETGECRLVIPVNGEMVRIQLDPVIIPLRNYLKNLHLAAILFIGAYQGEDHCLLEYRELSGAGTVFRTNDERLTKELYFKKGNVSESPDFPKEFNLFDGRLKLQFYRGDVFDLNFLEDMGESAFVNILYDNLEYKTPLSKRLEMLSGCNIKESLKNYRTIEKGKVYAVKETGALKFKLILHVPIYDAHYIHLKNPKENPFDIIRRAISNIIDECVERKVETLIVPALGSFWAGQTREAVATIWCDEIKRISGLDRSRLKRIIFSFINEETYNVYISCVQSNTDELYKNYHLPVSSLHNDMMAQTENLKRLERAIDLSEYLYGFLIAWAIRGIMREKTAKGKIGESFYLRGKKREFINEIKNCFGYGSEGSFKGMTPGIWQQLCKLGYDAIKNTEWDFDKMFPRKKTLIIRRKNKSKLATFHNFIKNSDDYAFPKWRNEIIGHATWHFKNDANLKSAADRAVNAIKEVIRDMEILDQENLKLIKVKKFQLNEDSGKGHLQYYDLRGSGFDYIQQKVISRKIADFGGVFFEENKVYLIREEETIKSILLHPFILYGSCPGCHRKTIFVWRDNRMKCRSKKGVKYGSISCECPEIETEPIAGFSQAELAERFENIIQNLDYPEFS